MGFSLGEVCPLKWRPVGVLQLALKTCCRGFMQNYCYVLYTKDLKISFLENLSQKTKF